ncbi:MAG: TonB-dependent receptor [Cyclobacteriaceae bacterium]|nr:TonB-dependent receptor [Cyclobacteriaceae bacterium HetDA_MAG_MS6]
MNLILSVWLFIAVSFLSLKGFSQTGSVSGSVVGGGKALEFASVGFDGTTLGTTTNAQGNFLIKDVAFGEYTLVVAIVGYQRQTKKIELTPEVPELNVDFDLNESTSTLDQVVVTGTRTAKKITNSPVIVDVINSAILENTQSVSLSEGLKFQPGLRVETDCQTCNYTQLRMNGLQGGYSQILINSRPVFSPLTGLYGMEQIPTNMIDRIEVVRGGGSALYGSGAVGGTVNVITKAPKKSGYDMGYTYQNIEGASEHILSGNATVLNESKNAGATFFVNKRKREWWDANGDNFSEVPEIENNSFGTNLFFIPTENQKFDINLSSLNEYRYGGEMVEGAAHLAQQSEERTHNVLVGNIDHSLKLNDGNSSILSYAAFQNTQRTHYTGIFPDEPTEIDIHLTNPPYGTSENTTWQGGVQFNHNFDDFPLGSNVVTIGMEYVEDDILDVIESYNYRIDQVTQNFGTFLQSDWELGQDLNLLSGVRIDDHNLVDQLVASPRLSLLYKPFPTTQLRATWGTGFRAPQAFDTDLHIAFAGGGVSRIQLSDELRHERSNSFSASINYDKATERHVFGFTAEGFHTYLRDAFFLQPLGEDEFGEVFEKQNGDGATVQGITLEVRANYDEKIQLDAGITFQSSQFDTPIESSDVLAPRREFLRTPNQYGFGTLTITPTEQWKVAMNLAYTGPMLIVHFAGAPEQTEDAFVNSQAFTELGLRTSYTLPMKGIGTGLELFGGIKNVTNSYQDDFDTGKNRDSNFVYGPAAPRTYFFGVRLKSL